VSKLVDPSTAPVIEKCQFMSHINLEILKSQELLKKLNSIDVPLIIV